MRRVCGMHGMHGGGEGRGVPIRRVHRCKLLPRTRVPAALGVLQREVVRSVGEAAGVRRLRHQLALHDALREVPEEIAATMARAGSCDQPCCCCDQQCYCCCYCKVLRGRQRTGMSRSSPGSRGPPRPPRQRPLSCSCLVPAGGLGSGLGLGLGARTRARTRARARAAAIQQTLGWPVALSIVASSRCSNLISTPILAASRLAVVR